MKFCESCGATLDPRTKGWFCRSCRAKSGGPVHTARLEKLAAQSAESRLSRFQIKLGPNECWGWSGCDNGVGYGKMRIHGQYKLATHVALEVDGRPRPSTAHVACHTCDNPPCTNPKHLWWGTEKGNMQDATSKGRMARTRESNGTYSKETPNG